MATLQLGSSGPEVRELQERLNAQGASPALAVDGEFGPKTQAAVVAFQTGHGLEPDGIVGPRTRAALGLAAAARNFGELVPIPADINPGVSAASQIAMLNVFGKPGNLTNDCSPVTNQRVLNLVGGAEDVGPFRVTGIRPAVDALKRIFEKVRVEEPALFSSLGTAGMLCCRRVRRTAPPPSPNFSNHSWGTAVDISIDGELDPRADGKAMVGLVILHKYFNEERFFWGAGFSGASEDSMHFEVSDELIQDWHRQGILG